MQETADAAFIWLSLVTIGLLIAGLAWHAVAPKPPRKFRSF